MKPCPELPGGMSEVWKAKRRSGARRCLRETPARKRAGGEEAALNTITFEHLEIVADHPEYRLMARAPDCELKKQWDELEGGGFVWRYHGSDGCIYEHVSPETIRLARVLPRYSRHGGPVTMDLCPTNNTLALDQPPQTAPSRRSLSARERFYRWAASAVYLRTHENSPDSLLVR
jgi:hypothetical protein